jgi:hypothetical protein
VAQLFRPGANSVAVLVIVALLVSPIMGAGLAYLIWKSPYATNQRESIFGTATPPFARA